MMRLLILFLITFSFTSIVYASADLPQNYHQHERNNHRAKSNQISNSSNTTPSPRVSTALTQGSANQTPNTDRTSTANDNKKWYQAIWNKTSEDPISFFTFLLAVFTLVLALSTIGLWIVTIQGAKHTEKAANAAQKAAEAADLSARAAIGSELPIIRARTADLLHTDKLITGVGPYGGSDNTGPPTKYSAIGNLRFYNYGRTPAFPEKLSAGWMVAQKLPDDPTYIRTHILSHAAVINPGDEFLVTDAHYGIELTEEEMRTTKEDQAWLWFYGCLYYRDFMNQPREARFCWRFANRNVGSIYFYFASDGEPPFKYTQKA